MLSTLLRAALSFLVSMSAFAGGLPGFRRVSVPAGPAGRPMEAVVWYPALPGSREELVGDNPVWVGVPAAVDAPPAPGRHPLVLLSHGYSGNWANQGWLAAELAVQGYVVAAPNHPGTTTRDLRPITLASLLERPRDLSRLLDELLKDPTWSPLIDASRIAAIGHSLGGWTVMELVGARLDPGRLAEDMRLHSSLAANRMMRGVDLTPVAGDDRRDPRIRAVVTLDLGLARGFDPASLAAVSRPVLVLAAGTDLNGVPAALESEAMAALLPRASTRQVTLAGAAHFSFLPLCKPGAAALLEQEQPGDEVVSQDGPHGDRAALHARIEGEVSRFLASALR